MDQEYRAKGFAQDCNGHGEEFTLNISPNQRGIFEAHIQYVSPNQRWRQIYGQVFENIPAEATGDAFDSGRVMTFVEIPDTEDRLVKVFRVGSRDNLNSPDLEGRYSGRWCTVACRRLTDWHVRELVYRIDPRRQEKFKIACMDVTKSIAPALMPQQASA